MRIILIQLYLLILCQAAETLDHLTDLGQNVTINCDLDSNEVYWILLKQSDSHTVILLRSFSNPTSAFPLNKTFKNKYSVQSKHELVIYNITVDELGVYYCMNTDTPPKLSNSTRLNINVTETNQNCTNNTAVEPITDNTWKTFSFISGVLNGVLIITIIGLLKVYVVDNGCWKKQLHNNSLQQTQVIEQHQDPDHLQNKTKITASCKAFWEPKSEGKNEKYVAVDFSKLRKNNRPSQENSTYAALKLPRSKVI